MEVSAFSRALADTADIGLGLDNIFRRNPVLVNGLDAGFGPVDSFTLNLVNASDVSSDPADIFALGLMVTAVRGWN
jgi:hypothetical protein